MKVIRFQIKGLLNSFRIPFFRTYHKTFLAPPKSTIIGMLCNISLKPQRDFFDILNSDKIFVSVVIDTIGGKTKDLWSYKTLEKSNMGKSVVRRDKLYLSSYIIYLYIDDKGLFDEIFIALRQPKNIPALGLDDELAYICGVQTIELKSNTSGRIDSVFLDKLIPYKAFIKEPSKVVELPTAHVAPTKFRTFDAKGNRISKEVIEEFKQVEQINCEVEFQRSVESFKDTELGYRMVFY